LRDNGIDVTERIPLITTPSSDNLHYLWTKQTRMGHAFGGRVHPTSVGVQAQSRP